MPLHEIDQMAYHQDLITAFFNAGSARNDYMLDTLLKMKGISLNIINEGGKSFIAAWCELRQVNQADFEKMEDWVVSGQVDLTFKCQGADIVDWCIENAAKCYDLKFQARYLTLAEKIIQFFPFNKELTQKYSALLPSSVKNPCTIRITKALLSLPDINVQQLGSNNKDAFQTALEAQNMPAITLLAETLGILKDGQLQSTSTNKPISSTLNTLKLLISNSHRLLFSNNTSEINESLVKLTVQMLHLLEESGEYPTNFAELLFELSNNLSSLSVQERQFEEIAYGLRKTAADLGNEQALRILTNFSHTKPEASEKLNSPLETQGDIKKMTLPVEIPSKEKASHTFFQRFKSKGKHNTSSPSLQPVTYTNNAYPKY